MRPSLEQRFSGRDTGVPPRGCARWGGTEQPASTVVRTLPANLLQKRHVGIIAESDKYRFRPKPDTKAVGDLPLDPHGERQHVACRSVSPVHNRQRVL